jgi:zinc protease
MRAAGFLLIAAVLQAQPVDRTKPPATLPVAPYKTPPIAEQTLANGLRVVVVRDGRFPLVTLRLAFHAGSKFDPKDLSGLAEMTAFLLKEGTAKRSAKQIAEQAAAMGGAIEAAAGPDGLTVSASALSEHLEDLLDLVAEVAQNPVFPEQELKLRKQNRAQELMAQRAEPAAVAEEKLHQLVFGTHPYARMLPAAESIERISRDHLRQFHSRFLIPNNAVLLLVGDVPGPDSLGKLVQSKFGAWAKGAAPPAVEGRFPPPRRAGVLVDRPGSVQADIRVGKLSVDRHSPDYFPLLVGNAILGGGASSRLFTILREQKGYAYDVHSRQSPRRTGGLFEAVTQVRNEAAGEALLDLLAELRRFSSERVSAEELTSVKNYLAGTFVIRLETQAGLADQLVMMKLMGLPDNYLETYVTRVRSVEPDQILKVAQKYINPADAALVVVGDAAQLGKQLEKAGKFVVERAK